MIPRPLKIGIGGPVGSGKTALAEALCRHLRDKVDMAVITNDIYTREDAEFLVRRAALPPERVVGVETGGCPHTAIREDASVNLEAIRDLLAVQHYADLPECSSCEVVGFCNRCHGDNLLERGEGEWKRCHERARTLAGAHRRLYQIRTATRS